MYGSQAWVDPLPYICLLFSGFSNVCHSAAFWPTTLKLGCITNFDMLSLVMGFISLVNEIHFMLISGCHISNRSIYMFFFLWQVGRFKVQGRVKSRSFLFYGKNPTDLSVVCIWSAMWNTWLFELHRKVSSWNIDQQHWSLHSTDEPALLSKLSYSKLIWFLAELLRGNHG